MFAQAKATLDIGVPHTITTRQSKATLMMRAHDVVFQSQADSPGALELSGQIGGQQGLPELAPDPSDPAERQGACTRPAAPQLPGIALSSWLVHLHRIATQLHPVLH